MEHVNSTQLVDVVGITIDQAALQAHEMRPPNLDGVTSSRGPEEGVPHPGIKAGLFLGAYLDVKAFADALHAGLKNSVIGYVMQLRRNGTTIYTLQWNWAKTPADGGQGWTPNVRMHVASCSKLITGIAMTRLLNDKDISFDTPIAAYLPDYWTKGANVGKITFRHLMTHTSGLNYNVKSSDSDYGFMKSQIAAGTTHIGDYWYQNMNFGLCRILISTINGNVAPGANLNDLLWDFTTIQAYTKYVQDRVFTPAGVSGPTLDHPSADALAYLFPSSGNGWNSGNLAAVSGGAAWHMSPDDMLDVMSAFRRAGTIMTAKQAQAMLDNGFGIDVRMSTPLGTLYNKNGLWRDGSGRTEQSLAYFLPGNMELVVLANSPVAPGLFFRDVVTNIFLANIRFRAHDAVWRPGNTPEVQYYGLKFADYQKHYDDLWKQNFRIYLLNTYEENGQRLYDAVWRPGTTAEVQYYGQKFADYQKHYDDLWKQNFRIHLLNTYEENGQRLYDAVWRPGNTAEVQYYGLKFADYQKHYDELWKQNFRIYLLNTYEENGQRLYDAVWRPGNSAEVQYYGQKYADFQKHYDDLWKQNFRIYLLNTYEEKGQLLYDAVWRPGDSAEVQLYGLNSTSYQKQYDDLWKQNYRIHLLNTYSAKT